ncbi:cyclophilin B [Pelomyxa schiedti]|nr:cyclophilin B [Pelomyxa schiedti]
MIQQIVRFIETSTSSSPESFVPMLNSSPNTSPTTTPVPSPISSAAASPGRALTTIVATSLETYGSASSEASSESGHSSHSSSSSSPTAKRRSKATAPSETSDATASELALLDCPPVVKRSSSRSAKTPTLAPAPSSPPSSRNDGTTHSDVSKIDLDAAPSSTLLFQEPSEAPVERAPSHTPNGPPAHSIHLALPHAATRHSVSHSSPPTTIPTPTLPESHNEMGLPRTHAHSHHNHRRHSHNESKAKTKLKDVEYLDFFDEHQQDHSELLKHAVIPTTSPAPQAVTGPPTMESAVAGLTTTTLDNTPQPTSTTTTTVSVNNTVVIESAVKTTTTPNPHRTAPPQTLPHLLPQRMLRSHTFPVEHDIEQPHTQSVYESLRRTEPDPAPTERARGLTLITPASGSAVNPVMPQIDKMMEDIREIEEQVYKLGTQREKLRAKLLRVELEESKRLALLQSKKEDVRRTFEVSHKQIPPSLGLSFLTSMTDSFFHLTDVLPMEFITQHMSSEIQAIENVDSEGTLLRFSDVFSAKAVSTYPYDAAAKKRLGNPLCDHFQAKLCSGGRAFLCVTDGCNWGAKPKEAAARASSTFINFLFEKSFGATSVREYGALMIQALAHAHNAIVWDKHDIVEVGTTTLLGVTCVPTRIGWENEPDESVKYSKWACIVLSIGDCKAFRWSAKEKKVFEITYSKQVIQLLNNDTFSSKNRGTLDPSDPGGRIGPFLVGGAPDLRNLSLYYAPCHKHDIIILLSDGVHDNLEAPSLAVEPGDLIPDFVDKNWDEATALNPDLASKAREDFMTGKLTELISPDAEQPQVDQVVERIINYCVDVTNPSRTFLEKNPRGRLPHDFKMYPGKLDHTTCMALSLRPSWA